LHRRKLKNDQWVRFFFHANNLVFILKFDKYDVKSNYHSAYTLLEEIRQSVEKYLKITITLGIGNICNTLQKINESYKSAVTALDYKLIIGDNRVIYIGDIEPQATYNLIYDDIKERNLINSIKFGTKKITAKKVIIASHYPFIQKKGMYFSKLYCERAYIIAVKAREKYPGGMYINAEDPSRSLRGLNNDSDELVLIAGESHKTGQGKDLNNHYRALAEFAGDIFTIDDIPYRWSAQDCMTLDGIPYIGNYAPDTPDLYIATGFQKWGMTSSMVSAMIIRDLISKGENPWQNVFDPSRKNIAGSVKKFYC
jgi:hypothetical protein